MHKGSLLRMEWFVENYLSGTGLRVLDVGSMDVNGSYKHLFKDHYYIGLDITDGKNVDIVVNNPYSWSEIETDSFDVVISGQCFEHSEFFWLTMSEMTRVLKKGGLMCIIAPNGFKEHRYPVDCYRFFTDGMIALARYVNLEVIHAHTNCAPKGSKGWYSKNGADSILIASKPYSGNTIHLDTSTYYCIPTNHTIHRDDLVPYQENKLLAWLEKSMRSAKTFISKKI